MTPKERAAMRQALEAIGDCSPNKALVKAAYALREALPGDNMSPTEQAEQEPVAWLWFSEHGSERLEWEQVEDTSKWKSTPLYAAPVRTKDLTDDELPKAAGFHELLPQELYIARAVIQADREKNK